MEWKVQRQRTLIYRKVIHKYHLVFAQMSFLDDMKDASDPAGSLFRTGLHIYGRAEWLSLNSFGFKCQKMPGGGFRTTKLCHLITEHDNVWIYQLEMEGRWYMSVCCAAEINDVHRQWFHLKPERT